MISRTENAVAVAAQYAFCARAALEPSNDVIATAIPWKKKAEELSEAELRSIGGFESIQRFALGGNPLSLFRYLYFELTVELGNVDPDKVLRAIADDIENRRISTEKRRPASDFRPPDGPWSSSATGVGRFLTGPLGVIELPRPAWTLQRQWVENSYASWQSSVRYGGDSVRESHTLAGFGDLFDFSGWSTEWRDWFCDLGLIWQIGSGGEALLVWENPREQWSPLRADIPNQFRKMFRSLQAANRENLSHLLECCIDEFRGEFFEGVEYKFARRALKALSDKEVRSSLSGAEIWHLLHVLPSESVAAVACDLGLTEPAHSDGSFSENFAAVLIYFRDSVKHLGTLEQFLGHAHGAEYDQVLHLILREQEPLILLRQFLFSDAEVTRAFARWAAAPVRFHKGKWDRTDPDERSILTKAVARALGIEELPSIRPIALPLGSLASGADKERLRAFLNNGRIRSEWILRTASQYCYQLIKISEETKKLTIAGFKIHHVTPFERDKELSDWAASHPYKIDLDALSGSHYEVIISHLVKLAPSNPPSYLHRVCEAHSKLVRFYKDGRVGRAGNIGSHYNSHGLEEFFEASKALEGFDRYARSQPDVLPFFVRFVGAVKTINKPSEVLLATVDAMKLSDEYVKLRHFVSANDCGAALRGDRIYSFTDVTKNHISINPIIIDWTDYLLEPT